jgi:hypothetical protein
MLRVQGTISRPPADRKVLVSGHCQLGLHCDTSALRPYGA